MENLIRRLERAVKPGRLAAAAIAVVAGTVWMVAGPASAAVKSNVVASLSHGVLIVSGTDAADNIALRLQAGNPGVIQVDADNDGTADFSFTRAQVARIAVAAGAGDDHVRIDDVNGAFTNTIPTAIDGGAGNDSLVGGAGGERLVGGDGNDSIDGKGGSDSAFMGAGDDTFVWDPGDGSDTLEGQAGNDTMQFDGANAAEHVDLSARLTATGSRFEFVRDIANVRMDTAGIEQVDFKALGGADVVTVHDLSGSGVAKVNLDLGVNGAGDGAADSVTVDGTDTNDTINVIGNAGGIDVAGLSALVSIQHQETADGLFVNGLGGDDAVSASGLPAQAIGLTLDGGAGNDRLTGGQGADRLTGGDGNDSIDGKGGNDSAFMGAGDDTFVWDPGDGSDTLEGQAGNDTMQFNGANIAEHVDLSANGPRLRFFRDIANITMDTAGIEQVNFRALGGADVITSSDLSGTDVRNVNLDLGANDGQPDSVIVNGTDKNDAITVSGGAGSVAVTGLTAAVNVANAEPANDTLKINALGGDDVVGASALAATSVKLTETGGDGADVLVGSAGDDALFGDAGDDLLIGGPGNDILDGGTGNNVLIQ